MDKEVIRHNVSLLLMDIDITNPIECDIVIGAKEAMGLSTLEMPRIYEII